MRGEKLWDDMESYFYARRPSLSNNAVYATKNIEFTGFSDSLFVEIRQFTPSWYQSMQKGEMPYFTGKTDGTSILLDRQCLFSKVKSEYLFPIADSPSCFMINLPKGKSLSRRILLWTQPSPFRKKQILRSTKRLRTPTLVAIRCGAWRNRIIVRLLYGSGPNV